MFRIAQEAINNAVNHAHATRLAIQMKSGSGQIELTVADNCKGLAKRRTHLGSGIDHMKTRAKLISARVSIQPGPGGTGTQVTIILQAAQTGSVARRQKEITG